MTKNRLEAFSDGVLAIIITIMVLEFKSPQTANLSALFPLIPTFVWYLISFIHVGIYWNNHHHLFQATERVNGTILWANLHLLFWLSLIPFVTAWTGNNNFARVPVIAYGVILFLSGVSYYLLTLAILAEHGPESRIAAALGSDNKGKLSLVLYLIALLLAMVEPMIACGIYCLVAAIWFLPDRRIEKARIPTGNDPHA